MKLAIFLNIRFYFDGKKYTADEHFFKFWTSFSIFFEEVILCVPVLENGFKRGIFEVEIDQKRIKICPFPYYRNSIDLYRKLFHIIPEVRRLFSENIVNCDVIGAVVPNIMGLSLILQAKSYSKSCFMYIRGNFKKTIKYEYRNGLKKILGYLIASILELIIKRLANNTLTFTVGKELYDKYKKNNNPVFKVITSLISDEETVGTILNKKRGKITKAKLLYVGRLSPERGVSYLFDGLHQLMEKSQLDFTLTIVGSGAEELDLKEKIKRFGLDSYVQFLGYIPYGDGVINLYRESDIFIIPSLTEGVPKVLLEAMANGIPVIATSVGGIPDIIKDGKDGILVPPANSEAIVEAILHLVNDEELRFKLIKNGLETVKEYTLEKQRDRMITILESHFGLGINKPVC